MPKQKFWAVDSSGRVYSLDLGLLTWDEATQNAVGLYKRSFKRISVLGHCAWGVAADQHVYMCIFHTDSPIRVQKTCYENQRWSIFHGWGTKSLFGTDRYAWSSQDGKENLPKGSFKLPSGFWSWESDWYIDESVPSDSEGWQYALDFPATYYKERGKLSMVRRRKWARYMHFEGFDKWIQIPWDDDSEDRDPLQDIAIGGTEMPCQCPGFLAVWGISFTGKVLFREGIWNLCPEGERWVEIPSQGLNLAQLSVNRIGVVWAVSWDGKIFVRTGVSHKNPKGSGWSLVHPPDTGNDPDLKLFQLAAGKKTVWALTRSGQVFFRKGLDPVKAEKDARFLLGSGWVEMVGTMRLISVGPNEQVWGVGMNGNIYVRTHVTKTELVGRKWKQLLSGQGDDNRFQMTEKDPDTISIASSASTDEEMKSDTSSYYGQHWIWISSGACNVDAAFVDNIDKRLVSSGSMASIAHTTSLLRSKWRTKTLSALKKRNMKEVEAASSVFRLMNLGSVHWSKRGKGKLLTNAACNIWKDCHIKLQTDDDNSGGAFLIYFHTDKDQFEEMRIPLREIICVNMVTSNVQLNTFAVHTVEKTFRREPVTLSLENENEFFDWLVCLTYKTCEERLPPSMHRPTSKALWLTSKSGDVFFCNLPEEHDMVALPLSKMVWQQTGGHMRTITAGCNGIVYAIGFDGKAYVYSGGHGGSFLKSEHHSMDNIFNQVDYDTCYVYENQRWNPVEGFCDRLLPSDRWAWSDETGAYRFGCESYKLMTSQWKWVDEWAIDHSLSGGADDKGWQYAVDFPRSYHKQKGLHDYVRRRRWKRRCRLATTGPWIEVQSDILLADVSIQTDAQYTVAFSVAVWAVDVKGNVFYRMTVSKEDPKGSLWMHVPAPSKFLSVSVGYRRTVWGLAVDGSAYLRQGFDEDAMIGTHWLHISKQDTGTFSRVSCGECLVAAVDSTGILWHRDKAMPAFPEGLEWEKVLEGISDITVGSGDELWIIRKNDIELCVKAENQGLVGCQLVCVLSGFWNSVCIRGCSPEVAEAEECTVEETEVAAATPQKKVVPEVNPYKVDIFSFYNRNNPISFSLESEEDLDIEIVRKEDSIA